MIFNEIFKADGSEVYFKPMIKYINIDNETNFYSILKSGMLRNEIAIGYRIQSDYNNEENNYGVVLNPKKSDKFIFNKDDSVIVLAEH